MSIKSHTELRCAMALLLEQAEKTMSPLEIERACLDTWKHRKIARLRRQDGNTTPGFAGRVRVAQVYHG